MIFFWTWDPYFWCHVSECFDSEWDVLCQCQIQNVSVRITPFWHQKYGSKWIQRSLVFGSKMRKCHSNAVKMGRNAILVSYSSAQTSSGSLRLFSPCMSKLAWLNYREISSAILHLGLLGFAQHWNAFRTKIERNTSLPCKRYTTHGKGGSFKVFYNKVPILQCSNLAAFFMC